MFTEGEEMYLQGSTVWHPDCKQSTKTEEKLRPTRTSSESIYSRPGSSIPGSPGHTIYAKVDNEILDYKDLAAIPKVKAIYDIERPDLITYEPFYTSGYDDKQERQSLGESPRTLSPTPSAEGYQDVRDRMIHRSTSQGSINSPVYSRHSYTPTTSRSPQHFHRPDQGINIYRKPPIYKQHAALAAQSKSAEDIIKFSKFPAAQAPDPSEIPKIETDHWPGPPSLAAVGADPRRRSSGREEDEEELLRRRQLQEEQLLKLNSGLGQLILKEEMERESRERSSLPAGRYDSPVHSASHAVSSKTSSLPGYGRDGLHRPVSTDFAQYNSYGDVSGGVRDYQVWNAVFRGLAIQQDSHFSIQKMLIWVDLCNH
uniref:Actin binding LIM protein 1 n=1 Tax=Molossus molossus TaxID=27622 RepID=A0A7J8DMM9_MOLMO|nr:actin binding LIM protein 1 [Molossus molossus]